MDRSRRPVNAKSAQTKAFPIRWAIDVNPSAPKDRPDSAYLANASLARNISDLTWLATDARGCVQSTMLGRAKMASVRLVV